MAVAQGIKGVAGARKFAPGNKELVDTQCVSRQVLGREMWDVPEGATEWTFRSKKGPKCARRCRSMDLREQMGGTPPAATGRRSGILWNLCRFRRGGGSRG